MCKLYLKASLSKSVVFNPYEVAEAKRSRLITGQRDGFGFATASGVWKTDLVNTKVIGRDSRLPVSWTGAKSVAIFGTPKDPSWFLIAHSRTSTNQSGLGCAHPFVGKNWALIHNGIVSEIGDHKDGGEHPCDSARLHYWIETGGDMSKCKEAWGGYGAVIAYNYKKKQLHIWRERAPLSWQIIGDVLECATSSYDLDGTADSSGDVPDNSHTVISEGGKIETEHWSGFGIRATTPAEYCRTNGGFNTGRTHENREIVIGYQNGQKGYWKDGAWFPGRFGEPADSVMVRNKESFPGWKETNLLTAPEADAQAKAEEAGEEAADAAANGAVNTLAREMGEDYNPYDVQ